MSAVPSERRFLGTYSETLHEGEEGTLHINRSILYWHQEGKVPEKAYISDTESWLATYLINNAMTPMMSSEVQITAEEAGHLGFKPKNEFSALAKQIPDGVRGHFMHYGVGKGGWYIFLPNLPLDHDEITMIAEAAYQKVETTAKRNNDKPRQRKKREQVIDDYVDFLSGNNKEKFSKKKVAGAVAFITVGTTVIWKLASQHGKDS